MRVFSADLRSRIHDACLQGESTSEVAERFSVSSAFVRRLLQRFRETCSLLPKRTTLLRLQAAPCRIQLVSLELGEKGVVQ